MTHTLSNTMEQIVKKVLARHGLLGRGVLVAHSGGLDSTCLTMLLSTLYHAGDLDSLQVAHVDHGLRDCSATDAEASRTLADSLGLKFHLVTLGPGDFPGEGNVQATARSLRRKALEELARQRGLGAIALAHHADDQAETVLFRVLRGAGPRGAAGMQAWSAPYIRPLLEVRRAELERLAHELAYPYVTDPTNASDKYTRNRIRNELLGLAREIVPGADGALVRFSRLIGEDDSFISSLAYKELARLNEEEPEGLSLPVEGLAGLQGPVRRRLFLAALERVGQKHTPVELMHLEQIEALLEEGGTGKEAPIPGAVAVMRTSDRLWVVARRAVDSAVPVLPVLGETAGIIPAGEKSKPPQGALVVRIAAGDDAVPVSFSPKVPGDRLVIRGKERKVKDLLMKECLPSWRRKMTVVARRGEKSVAAFAPNSCFGTMEGYVDGHVEGEGHEMRSDLLWVAGDWWLRGLGCS